MNPATVDLIVDGITEAVRKLRAERVITSAQLVNIISSLPKTTDENPSLLRFGSEERKG